MASADVSEADERPCRTVLKRSRSEADLPPTPDSQLKRQKVSFSPNVKVRLLGDSTDESLAVVRENVRVALDRHRKGDDGMYNRLKEIFLTHPRSKGAPSRDAYRKHLSAVTAQAFHLGRDLDCAGLLRAMLGSYWLERDEQVWADFQRFLAALLTAHAVYLPTILNWLIDRFSETGPTEVSGVPRAVVNDRIHRTIISISQFVPAAESLIEESIRSCFPFFRAKASAYLAFLRSILEVGTYLPILRDRIIRLIMEKMVIIDASIGVSIEELDEDEIELLNVQVRQEMVSLFTSDALDFNQAAITADDSDNDSDGENDIDEASLELLKNIKEDMLKLDCTMSILFKNYHAALSQDVAHKTVVDGRSSLEASSAFESILFAFTDVVLKTHNSRHSQFLLFRFAQLQDEFFWRYTEVLLNVAFDKHGSLPSRLAALSYLASFLARGAKISNDKVVEVFDRFGRELEKLRKKHEPGAKGPDTELYHFYYALFQACMYIFCFRWKAFLQNPDDDESVEKRWHHGVKDVFAVNIHSILNPIKVSSSMVVGAFAKVTQALNFLYVFSILESNKRVRLTRFISFNSVARETALSIKTSEETRKVQAHFAFEPYALPVSRKWVEGLYLTFDVVTPAGYHELASEDEDEDSDEAEEEEEEEEDDDDNDNDNVVSDQVGVPVC